jgi:uncharacterized protein YecE (DUF72 family)
MPPRFTYTEEKLDRIIENLHPSYNNVVEFRHESWWQESVYQKLAKHRISFCGMSHPQLPGQIIQNTPLIYYRFHGVPQLYKTPYDIAALKEFIKEVETQPLTREVWCYFNNDIDANAPRNAVEMMELIIQ